MLVAVCMSVWALCICSRVGCVELVEQCVCVCVESQAVCGLCVCIHYCSMGQCEAMPSPAHVFSGGTLV